MRGRVGQFGASPGGVSKVRQTANQSLGTRKVREAGATVRCNVKLRDMDIAVSAQDERAIEVLALGLPLHHGAQLAVEVTLHTPNAAAEDGAMCSRARADKERKYAELLTGDRLSPGCHCFGNWRKMEQRSNPVHR